LVLCVNWLFSAQLGLEIKTPDATFYSLRVRSL